MLRWVRAVGQGTLSIDLVVIEYLITIILKFSSTIITKNNKNRVYT